MLGSFDPSSSGSVNEADRDAFWSAPQGGELCVINEHLYYFRSSTGWELWPQSKGFLYDSHTGGTVGQNVPDRVQTRISFRQGDLRWSTSDFTLSSTSFTCQLAGIYMLSLSAKWDPVSTGRHHIGIWRNPTNSSNWFDTGELSATSHDIPAGIPRQSCQLVTPLDVGDVIVPGAYQDSKLNAVIRSATFSAVWMGSEG